jgi:glycerophosphoryl diester phosphodiesterase
MSSRLVVAHRGAPTDEHENSLEAFEGAIRVGADMIEFDVQQTRDEILIVTHDSSILGQAVQSLTRAEIEKLTGQLPPLLDEVLELSAGRILLDIELKQRGTTSDVIDRVKGLMSLDDCVITSFLDSVVAEAHEIAPSLRTGLILGEENPNPYLRTRLSEIFPTERLRRCEASYSVPHFRLAMLGAVGRASKLGIESMVWTVNDEKALGKFLRDARVAGVITDRPSLAISIRERIRASG